MLLETQKHFSENASDHRQLTVNFELSLSATLSSVLVRIPMQLSEEGTPIALRVRASAKRRHAVLACGGAHHQNWNSKNFNLRLKLQQPLTISSMRYLCGHGQ